MKKHLISIFIIIALTTILSGCWLKNDNKSENLDKDTTTTNNNIV